MGKGSVAAERIIVARAGCNLKPSSMELGGSDAFIVLDDADLHHTLKWAVWGRMYNGGQTCCAAKRFIVVDSVADAFLAMFKAVLSELQAGRLPTVRFRMSRPADVKSGTSRR